MKALQGANLALRFCLELTALGILGYWGWSTGEGALRYVLAVTAVAAVILVWALFIAPKRTVELAPPLRLAIEFVVWAAAGAALYATGHTGLAAAFVAVAFASGTLNYTCVPSGTPPIVSPVAGLRISAVPPSTASIHLPPTKFW